MSFASLLGGIKPAHKSSDVKEKPASTRDAGLHDAARRLIDAVHAKDHEGVSTALSDFDEIRGSAGLEEEPESPQAEEDEKSESED